VKEISTHIAKMFELSAAEVAIFLSQFSRMELTKNTVFAEAGKVCNVVGLIEKGLFKIVYPKDGEEVVFEFAHEYNFISDYYSFVTQKPSEKEISCLEDTVVYVVSRDQLFQLAKEHPFIGRMCASINEKLFLRMHDRLSSMILDSVTVRYQKLLAERPDLAQRIPQYLLASYLNVTPETVSRIRRKMAHL
jgi:CRP-like cAMP-binding protein